MLSRLTIWNIAWKNVKSRTDRACVIIVFCFVLSASLFMGQIMLNCMESGLKSTSERLGADIVVVPANYYSSIENALFVGEPCTVYFDKEWLERLKEIEGIEEISSQLFLASLGSECCETLTQLIAFDEKDFVISPWINKNTSKEITQYEAVAGNRCGLKQGQKVNYYGVEFTIKDILEDTGMGYDYSIFFNYDGAKRMLSSESAQNFLSVSDENMISMINIKVKEGYDIEDVSNDIAMRYSEIAVYTTDKMLQTVEDRINSFLIYSNVMSFILGFLSIVAMMSIFSITVKERKREYGIYILFGTEKKQLTKIIVLEAAIMILSGIVLGIGISALIICLFQNLLFQEIGLPHLKIAFNSTMVAVVKSIGVTLGIGSISVVHSVYSILNCQGVELLKEGE